MSNKYIQSPIVLLIIIVISPKNVEVLPLDAKSPTLACAEQRRVPLLLPARLLFSKIIIPANDLSLPSTIIIARCDARAHPEELFGLRLSEALDTHDSTSRVKPVLKDLATLKASIGFYRKAKPAHPLTVHHTDSPPGPTYDRDRHQGKHHFSVSLNEACLIGTHQRPERACRGPVFA